MARLTILCEVFHIYIELDEDVVKPKGTVRKKTKSTDSMTNRS